MKNEEWIKQNFKKSLINRNIIITGGNSGIGLSSCKHFLSLKANLFLAVRSFTKASKIRNQLLKTYPKARINILTLDMSSFSSIDDFVNNIIKQNLKIDYFIFNAGVYNLPKNKNSDGIDYTLMTNFIGVTYLNELLIDYLNKSNQRCRIIYNTSMSALFGKLNKKDPFMDHVKYKKMKMYMTSKRLMNEYFYHQYLINKNPNLTFSLAHPGTVYTPLMEKGYSRSFMKIARPILKKVFHDSNKASLIYLKAIDSVNGSYIVPKGFLEFSGYPKNKKLPTKYRKNHELTYNYVHKLINEYRKDK